MKKARMLIVLAVLIFATRIQAADINENMSWFHSSMSGTNPNTGLRYTQCVVKFPKLICEHGLTPLDYSFGSPVICIGSGTFNPEKCTFSGYSSFPRCDGRFGTGICGSQLRYVAGDNTTDLIVACDNGDCTKFMLLRPYYESVVLSDHAKGCRYCAAQAIDGITCEYFHALYQSEHGGGENGGEFVFPEVTYPVEPVEPMNVKEVSESIWSVFVPLEVASIGLLVVVFIVYFSLKKIKQSIK